MASYQNPYSDNPTANLARLNPDEYNQIALQIQSDYELDPSFFSFDKWYYKAYTFWTYCMFVLGFMGFSLAIYLYTVDASPEEITICWALSLGLILQSSAANHAIKNESYAIGRLALVLMGLVLFGLGLISLGCLELKAKPEGVPESQQEFIDFVSTYGIGFTVIHLVITMNGCYKITKILGIKAELEGYSK